MLEWSFAMKSNRGCVFINRRNTFLYNKLFIIWNIQLNATEFEGTHINILFQSPFGRPMYVILFNIIFLERFVKHFYVLFYFYGVGLIQAYRIQQNFTLH